MLGLVEVLVVIGGILDVFFNNGVYVVSGVVEDLLFGVLCVIYQVNVIGWYELI